MKEEEDLNLKQAMEDSLRTHAEEELRMRPGLDIVLRRSTAEARYPPLSPPRYDTMDVDLPSAPSLHEGLIG